MPSNKTFFTPEDIAKSWTGKFHFKKEVKHSKPDKRQSGLRPPQIGALHSILAHLECGQNENGIVVMPTGTGKTETMLSFLVANQCVRTLVIVPSDSLRTQIANKYKTLGVLKDFGIIEDDAHLPNVNIVIGGKTKDEWTKLIADSNVIVTTMASVTGLDHSLVRYIANNVDFLIVDEAHHSKANTWATFISNFRKNKVLLFTATPFRNDGKRLDGKILFNYSLKMAQEDGYYKPIKFHPVMKYNREDGDIAIAAEAVRILREDLKNGYNHILMARCKDKRRAEQIFEIYQKYDEFNPVLIHSQSTGKKEILSAIKDFKHRIIICVNMLGEGYDLPELKIAAVHDERQSLPITLQFIGRFTRTSKNLGNASFVTNIAYSPIKDELVQLYQQDADWNILLPRISDGRTKEEQTVNDFMRNFKGSLLDEISINDIRPAMSAEIFTCRSATTNWEAWKEKSTLVKQYKYQRSAHTNDMLVVVLGKFSAVDWGDVNSIENLTWDLIVVYFDALHKRIYLNSTIKLKGENFLEPIFGPVTHLSGNNVFRVFADVKRLMLTNVGTRRSEGKDISFQSFFGSSVQDGIDSLQRNKLAKNNIFGIGYRDGTKKSLGASFKGKLWSRERANLCQFRKWCLEAGSLVFNDAIDPDEVLDGMLKYRTITHYPKVSPLNFDWGEEVYEHSILQLQYGKDVVSFEDCSISVDIEQSSDHYLYFSIENDAFCVKAKCHIGENGPIYDLISPLDKAVKFIRGRSEETINEFFSDVVPKIYFADGSVLYGNHLIDAPMHSPQFVRENLISVDWSKADLKKESQWDKKTHKLRKDSIQYVFSQIIWNDYKVIIDDDGSGEVADLIGINETDNGIDITLYHLKFALRGKVSQDINNLYQVCGQAIKSVRWKYLLSKKIFDQILSRNERKIKNGYSSSILKGDINDVERYREQALNSRELRFHIVIVQPGMSKQTITEEMLILLGNVKQYLFDVSAIDLQVICSE